MKLTLLNAFSLRKGNLNADGYPTVEKNDYPKSLFGCNLLNPKELNQNQFDFSLLKKNKHFFPMKRASYSFSTSH
ncbi:hypothetical protein [Flavobacterium sp. J27]|uniref:hypothetical protein n=1 Tax=Flavobacterium sp. J27 TaxID=2060419 RepID=UPI00103210CF|nr:hypothetical protein [Flavobacterium sp. J27]